LNESDDLVEALKPVVLSLKELSIPHYVGGSVDSSFHGATRSTMDVDLVCELTEDKVTPFVGRFTKDFYISETAIREAVRRKSCFNLVHLPTSFKVDIFVSRGRPFDLEAMRRANLEVLGDTSNVSVPIATVEDSIVSKLEWFRLTNETSERQWNDVSRLIRLSGETADLCYLRKAADSVGVRDLLERLLSD